VTQCEAQESANERAPVHSSIAGPCHFVVAKDIWYTPVVFRDRKRLAFALLSCGYGQIVGGATWLAAADRFNVRRDLAAEQGRWLSPVASCSSPRVVRRTSVRFYCVPADHMIRRHFLRWWGAIAPGTSTGASQMLRQLSQPVKL